MPKRFVKLTGLILFALCFCQAIFAQKSDCGLPIAPRLNNFTLGMSPAEAQAAVGKKLKIKVKSSGQRTFFQNFIDKPSPAPLDGVRAIYLRFFDGKLYQIEFFYENRTDWQTLSDFTANLSVQNNFPASVWREEKMKAFVRCGIFSIFADKILNPHVELTDEIVRAKVKELQKK